MAAFADFLRRHRGIMAGGAVALLAITLSAAPAQAWWNRGGGGGPGWGGPGWGGGGWGGGVFIAPPPLVVPVPIYPGPAFAAPPAYYPPVYDAPVAAQECYAGLVSCPLRQPLNVGASCSCPSGNGQVFGAAG